MAASRPTRRQPAADSAAEGARPAGSFLEEYITLPLALLAEIAAAVPPPALDRDLAAGRPHLTWDDQAPGP